MQLTNLSSRNAPQRILLTTAERVGDTLFCTPAIRLLKASLPDIQFDVLAFSEVAADIFEGNPCLEKVHVATHSIAISRIINDYPLTINLMFEMLKKTGHRSERFISIGPPILTIHRTQQVIDFVKSILENPVNNIDLDYDIFPLESDERRVTKLLNDCHVDLENEILVGCQLGCHRVARRGWKIWNRHRHHHKKVWSLEKYIELAQRLVNKNSKIKFILTGASSECYLAKKFLAHFPSAIDLIGKTSIHEVTALMDLLNLFITHDTGTLHLACARKTPLVMLFGPTPPEFTGPYPLQPQYNVIRKKTIGDIEVGEVLDAALFTINKK